MNIKQAKNILLTELLARLNVFPAKISGDLAMYFAINREEIVPSLSVSLKKNTALDFGTGKVYDSISLVQEIKKCSVSEALKIISEIDFSSSFQKQENLEEIEEKNYKILVVEDEISHPALIQYLLNRKVWEQRKFLKEIHYRMNDKNYFGIGFKNDSGGYEIRNKYSKICLGKKDVSMIKNGSENLKIFEGFFDFLSFKNIEKSLSDEKSDYIILNSVSMISKIKSLLENHKNIGLYFDNDEAGNRAVETLKKEFENVEDDRILYKDFKDLNDWAISSPNLEEKLGGSLVQKVPKVYNKRGR